MLAQLDQIQKDALSALAAVTDTKALDDWRVMHLGKKSPLMTILGDLGKLSKEERPAIGKRGNEVKRALETALDAKIEALRRAEMERAMRADAVDVTLPGRPI